MRDALRRWANVRTCLEQADSSQDQGQTQGLSEAVHKDENVGQGRFSGTSKDRLFFALPNFLTLENAGQVPPLTAAEKFKVTLRSSFDPIEFVWYGSLASISLAENSEGGYGRGGAGYWKRYGASFADGAIENLTTQALFPFFLHQDARHFQLGNGGFWRRTGYAMSHILLTRTDSGHTQFNYSEILGSASAAGRTRFLLMYLKWWTLEANKSSKMT